jgi:hypothetical protein
MCNLYGIPKIKRPSWRSCARFGAATIYDEPHKLRKYRNKVHIQTDVHIKDVSRDEPAAFSKTIVDWSLGLIVRVLNLPERDVFTAERVGTVRPRAVDTV